MRTYRVQVKAVVITEGDKKDVAKLNDVGIYDVQGDGFDQAAEKAYVLAKECAAYAEILKDKDDGDGPQLEATSIKLLTKVADL